MHKPSNHSYSPCDDPHPCCSQRHVCTCSRFHGHQYAPSCYGDISPNAVGSEAHGPPGANIFVFHIPNVWTHLDLAKSFAPMGHLVSARIASDKATGRQLGFGFVSYTDVESACNAVKLLNGYSAAGKRLKVTFKRGEQHFAAAYLAAVSVNKNARREASEKCGLPPSEIYNRYLQPERHSHESSSPSSGGSSSSPFLSPNDEIFLAQLAKGSRRNLPKDNGQQPQTLTNSVGFSRDLATVILSAAAALANADSDRKRNSNGHAGRVSSDFSSRNGTAKDRDSRSSAGSRMRDGLQPIDSYSSPLLNTESHSFSSDVSAKKTQCSCKISSHDLFTSVWADNSSDWDKTGNTPDNRYPRSRNEQSRLCLWKSTDHDEAETTKLEDEDDDLSWGNPWAAICIGKGLLPSCDNMPQQSSQTATRDNWETRQANKRRTDGNFYNGIYNHAENRNVPGLDYENQNWRPRDSSESKKPVCSPSSGWRAL